MTAEWRGFHTIAEARDQRPALRNGRLHRREGEGCRVAFPVVPDRRDPERVRIGRPPAVAVVRSNSGRSWHV